MAYYPAQDTTIVYGKTKEEMEANVQAKMAEGYFPVSDTEVWNAKLVEEAVAYRQAMVKRENTDPQFIAAMYAAFKPALDDIRAQLANINTKLDTANSRLASIVTNTNRIQAVSATAETPVAEPEAAAIAAPLSAPVATVEVETTDGATGTSDSRPHKKIG